MEEEKVLQEPAEENPPVTMKSRSCKPLVLAKVGIAPFLRHFIGDFLQLVPRAKRDKKYAGTSYVQLNDLAESHSCDAVILFETRHTDEYYMWTSLVPGGPTVCFYVENLRPIEELHAIGKCSHKSRPLLFFDPQFDQDPKFGIAKELLRRVFSLPYTDTQKFVDTAISFFMADKHIWVARYQIMWDEGKLRIFEAGPRFCLRLMLVLSGSFCGRQIYKNTEFVTPHKRRKLEKKNA